jgi:hypothetical protein
MIMIGTIGHKMAAAAAVAALAAGGSAMFAGTAFAGPPANSHDCGCQPAPAAPAAPPAQPAPPAKQAPVEHNFETNNVAGAGGAGGNSSTRCAVPVGLSGSLILAQSNDVSQCNATAGLGGLGGAATNY